MTTGKGAYNHLVGGVVGAIDHFLTQMHEKQCYDEASDEEVCECPECGAMAARPIWDSIEGCYVAACSACGRRFM